MACCIFKNCFNKPTPFSKIAFFSVPKDARRELWLLNSGNKEVQNLPVGARRLVCDAHFEEKHLRRQFNRTTLTREAVPLDYQFRKEVHKETGSRETTVLREITPEIDKESADEPFTKETEYELIFEDESCTKDDTSDHFDHNQINGESTEPLIEPVDSSVIELREPVYVETVETLPNARSQHDNKCSTKRTCDEIDATLADDQLLNEEHAKRYKTQEIVETVKVCEVQTSSSNDTPGNVDGLAQQSCRNDSSANQSVTKMSEEEYFALSLVGPLQRLPLAKRAMAKAKILSYLVQLELGIDSQL